MQQPARKYYTPAEYLALEESATFKSEYYKGECFAMAGASLNRSRINRNLLNALTDALKNSTCEAFANETKVWIKSEKLFAYPDLIVICGEPAFYEDRNDTVTNPQVIVEILSDSTKNYDRGEKFKFYRTLPTLREYVLIDQYSIHVEQFAREKSGKWVLAEYQGADTVLKLSSLSFEMAMSKLYERVKLNQQSV